MARALSHQQQPEVKAVVAELRELTGGNWPRHQQVGETPLLRARRLEVAIGEELKRRAGFDFDGHIFVKLEGRNATATHKDRMAMAHARRACEEGRRELTIASCGNAAEALAVAARCHNLRCTVFVAKDALSSKMRDRLQNKCGAQVREIRGDYDSAVAASRRYARKSGAYDGNSGGPNSDLEHSAYAQIITEIAAQLAQEPSEHSRNFAGVAAPVGNGALFVGLASGLDSAATRRLLTHTPQLIGGTVRKTNPLSRLNSIQQPLPEPLQNLLSSAPDTAALATRDPCDAALVKAALHRYCGNIFGFEATELHRMKRLLSESLRADRIKTRPLAPSVAGLAALCTALKRGKMPADGTYVVVVSGEED